jgi:hypothetical protein
MELKDFIKAVFERPDEFKEISGSEKARNFFMLQRFMSINFPTQAQAFNHIRIPQSQVVDYWHDSLRKIYTKTPQWVYTKTKKSDKAKKIEMPSEEAISYYLERTKMSRRDLSEAIKIMGDSVLDPIRKIEAILKE